MGMLLGVIFLSLLKAATTMNSVQLSTDGTVTVPCGGDVTLNCNISPPDGINIRYLEWFHKDSNKSLCQFSDGVLDHHRSHGVHCNYTPKHQLSLTVRTPRPLDQGDYICKLRSNLGIKYTIASVKLQECYRDFKSFTSTSKVTCNFSGVFPEGQVHWFDSDRRVTSEGSKVRLNLDGSFEVTSTLHTTDTVTVYNCCLWFPSTGVYLPGGVGGPLKMISSGEGPSHVFGLLWVLPLIGLFSA